MDKIEPVNDKNKSVKTTWDIMNYKVTDIIKNYFQKVIEKLSDEAFESIDIFTNDTNSRKLKYLCFWYPFSLSDEPLVNKILKIHQIFLKEIQIDKSNFNSFNSKDYNTYAFEIALELNFPDDLIEIILNQGKVCVTLEWVSTQLEHSKFILVERAWKSRADCKIESEELKASFQSLTNIYKNKEDEGNKNEIKYTNIINRRKSNKNLKSILWKNIGRIYDKELKFFTENLVGKLTLSKIIILTKINFQNSILKSYEKQENQDIFEKKARKEYRKIIRNICLFDKIKSHSVEIIEALYYISEKKIARELLEANMIAVDLHIFRESLYYKDFKFTLFFFKSFNDFSLFNNENMLIELIENLQTNTPYIEYYTFFLKKLHDNFTIRSSNYLVKIVEDTISFRKINYLTQLSNPFKNYVLLAEILKILSEKFTNLKFKLDNLINSLLEYCEKLQDLVKEENLFYEMFMEKDLEGRSLINVISDNGFIILLKNNLVERNINYLWNGPYNTEGSFLEVSSNFRHLKINLGCKDYDIFTKQRNSLMKYNPYSFKTNFTHFKVWRKNINTKFRFELLINISFFVFFLVFSLIILRKNQFLLNLKSEEFNDFNKTIGIILDFHGNTTIATNSSLGNSSGIITNLTSFREYFFSIKSSIEDIQNIFEFLMNFSFPFFFFSFSYIIRFIFMLKSNAPSFGSQIFPDFMLCNLSLFIKIFWKQAFNNQNINLNQSISNIQDFSFLADFHRLEPIVGKDLYKYELILLTVITFLLWLKTLALLRGTRTIGPLIVIFLLSVKGIFLYILSYLVFIFVSAAFGLLLFYRPIQNITKNWLYSFMYFFFISFGNDTSYNDYLESKIIEDSEYIPYIFAVFIVFFLISTSLIFVNLLIAVLANIYDRYYSQSLQLFIQQKLMIRRFYYSDDERYDSLLNSNYPFTLITLPISFLFLFMKNIKMINFLNQLVLYLNFFFFGLLYSKLFSIFTLFLIPFSYIWVVLCKFFQLFVDDIQEYFLIYKVISLILYIIFGPLFHIKCYFFDIIIFVLQLFRRNINFSTENDENGKYYINKRVLSNFVKLIEEFNKEHVFSKLPLNDLFEVFNEYLEENDLLSSKHFLKLSVLKYSKQAVTLTSLNVEEKLVKNLSKNGVDFVEFNDCLSNFIDENNFLDLFLAYSVLKRRIKLEKNLNLQRELFNHKFDFKVLKNNFYHKAGLTLGITIGEDESINRKDDNERINSSYRDIPRCDECEMKDKYKYCDNRKIKTSDFYHTPHLVNSSNNKQIRLNSLGKIKQQFVIFVIIPRKDIFEFLASTTKPKNKIEEDMEYKSSKIVNKIDELKDEYSLKKFEMIQEKLIRNNEKISMILNIVNNLQDQKNLISEENLYK